MTDDGVNLGIETFDKWLKRKKSGRQFISISALIKRHPVLNYALLFAICWGSQWLCVMMALSKPYDDSSDNDDPDRSDSNHNQQSPPIASPRGQVHCL